MKKLILSLVAFLTLGLTTAKAETIFDANFENLANSGGGTTPQTSDLFFQAIMQVDDMTFTTNGVQWSSADGLAYIGANYNPAIYSVPQFICNNKTFENGADINEIAVTIYLLNANTNFSTLTGSLELYSNISNDLKTFSYPLGDAITFSWELEVNQPQTFTVSIPAEYARADLYYKLNFNATQNGNVNNTKSIAISDIKYNHVESEEPVLETAATPTFTPAGGVFNAGQLVEIACETEGASIYYTTDGNNPTSDSSKYESPIELNETTTLKAIAIAEDYYNSNVASATFYVQAENTALFQFTSAEWLSEKGLSVGSSITSIYQNNITYTGSDSKISDNSGSTVLEPSTYFTLSAKTGSYIANVKFNIAKSGQIYTPDGYLLSGDSWTPSDQPTSAQFRVNLIANVLTAPLINSIEVTYAQMQVATPVISPENNSEIYSEKEYVTITCATEGATIYYTKDGTTPDPSDSPSNETFQYDGPFELMNTDENTVKAIAVCDGYLNSEVATVTYLVVDVEGTPENGSTTFNFADNEWLASQIKDLEVGESIDVTNVEFTSEDNTVGLRFQNETGDSYKATLVKGESGYELQVEAMLQVVIGAGAHGTLASVDFTTTQDASDLWWRWEDLVDTNTAGMMSGTNSWTVDDVSSASKVKAIAEEENTGVVSIPLQTIAFTSLDPVTITSIAVGYKGVITGIDEIEAENDAEAVYYNLQGVRVANPEKGIYIVVKGNKVTKQVF